MKSTLWGLKNTLISVTSKILSINRTKELDSPSTGNMYISRPTFHKLRWQKSPPHLPPPPTNKKQSKKISILNATSALFVNGFAIIIGHEKLKGESNFSWNLAMVVISFGKKGRKKTVNRNGIQGKETSSCISTGCYIIYLWKEIVAIFFIFILECCICRHVLCWKPLFANTKYCKYCT